MFYFCPVFVLLTNELLSCRVMKQAAMPSCLGGEDNGINIAYRVDH